MLEEIKCFRVVHVLLQKKNYVCKKSRLEKDVQLFLDMRQKLVWKYAKLKVSKHKDEDICRVTPWPNFIDINDVILNIVHCSIIKSNHTTTIVIAVSNTVSESFPGDEGFFFIVPRPYILFFFMIMFKVNNKNSRATSLTSV